ncbi:MAG TPA: long-chain fatty acid--CoA ligase [Candidatus Eremiobacteraceae bacterium]|nr:long-chain fatty acid--CoA ligase [Candidatus Eremiobacteraceae bacterium]
MKLQTLNDIFFTIVKRTQEPVMLVRDATRWVPISAQELYRDVAGMARALHQWGLTKGDRLAILSENRLEWAVADFASLLLGVVVVPIYSTLTAQQSAHILRDSGARVVVVSTVKQLEKVLSIKDQTAVERVVVMDPVETAAAAPMRQWMREGPGLDLKLEACARAIGADDLASIIYTSGTTGSSKGVQLTHGNLTANVLNSLEGFDIHPGQVSISFLPLSHVTARHADWALLYRGVTLAYCPFIEQLPQTMLEVSPNVFVAVPRVYEKIYSQVEQKAKGFAKRAIYQWALSVGRAHSSRILAGEVPTALRWKLADKLVYSQVRARMGGKVEIFVSGGAPLGKELAAWYASMGVRIHEGYGMTETSPVIAINTPRAHRMGTVGRPLSNVEVQIADDWEILVRGPSIFRGYWNRPEETRNAFVDGWFKTGDIGKLDDNGFLSVTDRKKDLLKTSGGKFIAPQPIENSIKLNALIGAAVVLGDRRKFVFVLISPCFPLLEDWARANDIPFFSRQELVANPKVKDLYEGIVAQVNRGLARFETLKKVLLVPDEFTANDDVLTPTLKLRRKAIEERYRKQIDDLYEETEVTSRT